ncbi:MAG TPA: pitrilysin family protein [Thermoanaerobaculia bacterium]|nr:pitrilysin family protein [Thermoanaerobaculia bacterium]
MRPFRAKKILFASVALLSATSVVSAATAGKKSSSSVGGAVKSTARMITSVEGITEFELSNGLRVLLAPDPSKPTITVNITYLVGSRHENYGETGMAHLLEHLMFKGSLKHPNIPQELTSHGARPNGTTWFDRTNYYETFGATDENLNWALSLEADRMVNSFIAKKDLDSEMTVVRNEFESGENEPRAIIEERAVSTAYLWHNYGNSTIGARADLENVPIDRLQAFWRTYYQPDNAVLLIGGKIDEAKTLALVKKYFGPIRRPSRKLPKTYTAEPTQDGERTVTLRRVGDVQVVNSVYHVPAAVDPDSAAVEVLVGVLGDTPAGRLHKSLVEARKASSVNGYMQPLREPGFMLFSAEVRQDSSLDDARDTMLKTIHDTVIVPVTQEEVERVKSSLLKNVDLTVNNTERLGLALSEYIALGDWRLFFLTRDRIRKVTPADVNRVAAAFIKPSNRTVGLFIPTASPDRAEIPPPGDVTAMVKDYKGDPAIALGEAFDPSPRNIEARTSRTALPNGLKVALLPKKTRGETVAASMTVRFGDESSLMNRTTAAEMVGSMLTRGTSRHTRQQLKDALDRLKARVTVTGGPTQSNISVETVRANLAPVMRLLGEILREPVFPSSEFEQLRQEQLAEIEQSRSDPQAMAVTFLQRHTTRYPRGDVRYVSTPDEDVSDLQAAKLEDVKRFYSDFYGASVGELAVVGDFDKNEVTALATEIFGSWKSPRQFARVTRSFQDVPQLTQSLEAPDKANAFFVAGLNLNIRDDDPDFPAMLLGNYMLGGGFLNSRLASRIRQKDGLSYGVGSQFNASPLDKNGSFMTFAIYAPENASRLEAAFKEEIARALKDGFTAQEISEAKSGYLQSRQLSRAQDASLARSIAAQLFLDRTLVWDENLEKKIAALTPAAITAAMRRQIDPSKITIVKAGDFAKASKTKP